MTSSALIPVHNDKQTDHSPTRMSSTRYSIFDNGQGCRTYSYEFDLFNYEPEQINVLLDDHGRLRIRASRSPCHEFKREYHLGGPNIETRLVRNTIDSHGRLHVDIDVRPRRDQSVSVNNHVLTFDLQGYRPKNVNVRINEHGLLKINAQYHDNTLGNHIDREFYRQYQLPAMIRSDQVRAKMDENRILTIELPQNPVNNKKQSWKPYEVKSNAYESSNCCNLM
jgi:HSP20 family molecular chaperone IbpA